MSDIEIGRKVLKFFWMWHQTYFQGKLKLSFDEFLVRIQPNPTKLNILMDGIGGGVKSVEISDSRIDAAMRNMAIQSQGKLPKDGQVFFKFLINESTKIDWVDATIYVAKESAGDVLKGAQAVGDSLISAGKILNFLLPAIVLGAVFFWLNDKSGGRLARGLK